MYRIIQIILYIYSLYSFVMDCNVPLRILHKHRLVYVFPKDFQEKNSLNLNLFLKLSSRAHFVKLIYVLCVSIFEHGVFFFFSFFLKIKQSQLGLQEEITCSLVFSLLSCLFTPVPTTAIAIYGFYAVSLAPSY